MFSLSLSSPSPSPSLSFFPLFSHTHSLFHFLSLSLYSFCAGEFDNAGAMMSVDETLMCSFQVRERERERERILFVALFFSSFSLSSSSPPHLSHYHLFYYYYYYYLLAQILKPAEKKSKPGYLGRPTTPGDAKAKSAI